MIRARLVFPLALGALGSCCALADEVIIGPSKDNTLFSSDAIFGGNTSDGAGPRLYVGQTNGAGARRALIAFDIASAVPSGANIDGVTLSFNVTSFHGFQTITVHRLLQDWGEGASNSGIPGGGGAPAQDGDATWFFHHYFTDGSSQPWNNPGGDFVPTQSASGNAAATTFTLSSPTMASDVSGWLTDPASNFGWILIGDEQLFGAADRLDSSENSNASFRPTLTIDYSVTPPPREWLVDADGSWGDPFNWNPNSVPDSPTAAVSLTKKITAPRTITLDGNRTIEKLIFDSPQRYTIAPGTGGILTIGDPNTPDAVGEIGVGAGSHLISAMVRVGQSSSYGAAPGAKLTFSGGLQIDPDKNLTISGGGEFEVNGPQNHAAGASLNVHNAALVLDSNAGTPATAATPAIANLVLTVEGAGNNGTSQVILNSSQDLGSLEVATSLDGKQVLDLNSSPTEFHAVRVYLPEAEATKSVLAAAINAHRTSDEGIFDSGLHPGAAVGIAALSDAHGDPYVLIRPTRIGDLNLDGAVTISDFIDLASHFNAPGDWQSGDLNGDGAVSISDFIDLASNFNTTYAGEIFPINAEDQAALNAFAAAHGVSLVPEPGIIGCFAALAPIFARRRRR